MILGEGGKAYKKCKNFFRKFGLGCIVGGVNLSDFPRRIRKTFPRVMCTSMATPRGKLGNNFGTIFRKMVANFLANLQSSSKLKTGRKNSSVCCKKKKNYYLNTQNSFVETMTSIHSHISTWVIFPFLIYYNFFGIRSTLQIIRLTTPILPYIY